MLDVVSTTERNGKRGGYIAGVLKPMQSWFAWNEIPILQKIKIRGQDASTVSEERPPMPDELRMILQAADLRAKAPVALMAFCGITIGTRSYYII